MGRKLMITAIAAAVGLTACPKKSEDASAASAAPKTLYVATGQCNSGQGVVTYTAAQATKTIERFASDNGADKGKLIDYTVSNFITGTHPQNMIDRGSEILVMNDNGTTVSEKRIIRIPKADPINYKVYYANGTTFGAAAIVLRGMVIDTDGSVLFGKNGTGGTIEKINPAPVRVLANGNGWVNAPAGNCNGSINYTGVALTEPLTSLGATSGKIIFGNQGATAALQRLAVVKHSGYFAAADCAAGVQISTTPHTMATNLPTKTVAFNANGTTPTSMVYIPTGAALGGVTGKLIVTYSNSQTSNNAAGVYNLNHGIVMWDVTETDISTISLGNPVVLFDDYSIVYGASSIAYDAATGLIYVAVAGEPGVAATAYATNNVGYNIEKFSLNLTNSTLTRIAPNNQPFIRGNANTKCISAMMLAE